MLFSFLNYLQPTNYFQRYRNDGQSVFPKVEHLSKEWKMFLGVDSNYSSNEAQAYDMSWRAMKAGYLGDAETYSQFDPIPLEDNYRFIRKNFHTGWVLYVLALRLLSLNNPLKEILAWVKTRSVKKTGILEPFASAEYPKIDSSGLIENPLISVIIPTLNRYEELTDVLRDLEIQDYKNFEVIVIDQSDGFNREFYKDFALNFQIIHQKEKALWLARNTGIKHSKGTVIALSEDDVRINPDWLTKHLICLEEFGAQVSAGVFFPEGKTIPKERSYYALATQFATGNALLYKSVFQEVGLFDRQFERQRMGDGEFGMRLYLNNIRSISNPYAYCLDVKAATGGLREMGSWDAFRPKHLLAPRPIPSVIYYFRKYFGTKATICSLLRTVPFSIMPYQFKKNKPLMLVGGLISILFFPFILVQASRSWYLASRKIKEGPLIDRLVDV